MPNSALSLHIVTAATILLFKLGVLIVGYLIARLGYELLIRGIKGEFKFRGKYRETTLDLISASPGIFFIFLATVLLVVAVVKDKPFGTETSVTQTVGSSKSKSTAESEPARPVKPPLPAPER